MSFKRVNCLILSKIFFLILAVFILLLCYFYGASEIDDNPYDKIPSMVEDALENALQYDKGTGCVFPRLIPFSNKTVLHGIVHSKVVCNFTGIDWVRCNKSKCKITKQILDNYKNVECMFQDVIFVSDHKHYLSDPVIVGKSESYEYTLHKSDHVKVDCLGHKGGNLFSTYWNGHVIGFRKVISKPPPPNRKATINILIFGFDSASKNGFIRRMPNSYKMLKKTMKAHIFHGYSIVGDGTAACLFPLLTGKTELELPDVRIPISNANAVDSIPFIWYKLKDDGYRTAFFEDEPNIGSFQWRFNGFIAQPTDHYLRPYLIVAKPKKYCVGDTPTHKLMMNITKDFHSLPNKKFSLTWIVGVSHDNFNTITLADDDFTEFLSGYLHGNLYDNTLLIVMADHGPRYGPRYLNFRNTMEGKIEERMPFLSIILPKKLKRTRPDLDKVLRQNEKVLVTAHDLHTTLLDALDWREYWNIYKVKGTNLTRGLSLFEPIPKSRSCSEAGIEPHWCPCLKWENVTVTDKLYRGLAESFVEYINGLTERFRKLCAPRYLISIEYVQKHKFHRKLETYSKPADKDRYLAHFGADTEYTTQYYQIKVTVGPNNGIFEASAVYNKKTKKITFNLRNISRINAYGSEPQCIAHADTYLFKFCYCKN